VVEASTLLLLLGNLEIKLRMGMKKLNQGRLEGAWTELSAALDQLEYIKRYVRGPSGAGGRLNRPQKP